MPKELNLCLKSGQPFCRTSSGKDNQALAIVDAKRSSCHENDNPAGFLPPKSSPFSSKRFKKLSAAQNGLTLALCEPPLPPLLLPIIPGSSRGQNFMQCSNAASCVLFTNQMQSTGHISMAISIVSLSSAHWSTTLARPKSDSMEKVFEAYCAQFAHPIHTLSSTNTALVSPSSPLHLDTGVPSNFVSSSRKKCFRKSMTALRYGSLVCTSDNVLYAAFNITANSFVSSSDASSYFDSNTSGWDITNFFLNAFETVVCTKSSSPEAQTSASSKSKSKSSKKSEGAFVKSVASIESTSLDSSR
mmetsp:Transcript_5876/g.17291  ORF Transcript_5876/g.17291 Transcript_5876/m.17291 type:complete len:302 (+) Transcript_5876:122-1027(+)